MKAIAKQYKLTQREQSDISAIKQFISIYKTNKMHLQHIYIYLFCKNNIWTEFERNGDEKKTDGMSKRGRALAAHSDTLTINV